MPVVVGAFDIIMSAAGSGFAFCAFSFPLTVALNHAKESPAIKPIILFLQLNNIIFFFVYLLNYLVSLLLFSYT